MSFGKLELAIAGFEQLLAENAYADMSSVQNEKRVLREGSALLRALVASDDWLPSEYAQPDALRYQQYLLHADAGGRFSIVSFVWGPGQSTPVHDHTVWGLIGMLRGGERSERFVSTGMKGAMRSVGETILRPGDVEMLSPVDGDIHRVANLHDDRVSISIHVYGADIGKVRRHVYDPATGATREFVSGYANVRK